MRKLFSQLLGNSEPAFIAATIAIGLWLFSSAATRWNSAAWVSDTTASKSPMKVNDSLQTHGLMISLSGAGASTKWAIYFSPSLSVIAQCDLLHKHWPHDVQNSDLALIVVQQDSSTKDHCTTGNATGSPAIVEVAATRRRIASDSTLSFDDGFVITGTDNRVVYGSYRYEDLEKFGDIAANLLNAGAGLTDEKRN